MSAQTVFNVTYSQDADIVDLIGSANWETATDLDNTDDSGKQLDRSAESRLSAFNDINARMRGSHYRVPIVSLTVRWTGTAAAGAASTVTLGSSASSEDNFYDHARILISSGTGSGQRRTITSYVGATKVATVDRAWTMQPDTTSVIVVEGVPDQIRRLEAMLAAVDLHEARGTEDEGPVFASIQADCDKTLERLLSGAVRLDAM